MPDGIDPELLGERLRSIRVKRKMKLREVAEGTGVSVATLSRIERAESKTIESDTLIRLTNWMSIDVNDLMTTPVLPKAPGKLARSTPEVVELHLRADKNLDEKTAKALATMFRTVYEQFTRTAEKG